MFNKIVLFEIKYVLTDKAIDFLFIGYFKRYT
jgi:hypothetical protein